MCFTPMPKQSKPKNFEAALSQLEKILSNMEEGGLSLDASLKSFEEGIELTRHCQKLLQQAEQKVIDLGEEE